MAAKTSAANASAAKTSAAAKGNASILSFFQKATQESVTTPPEEEDSELDESHHITPTCSDISSTLCPFGAVIYVLRSSGGQNGQQTKILYQRAEHNAQLAAKQHVEDEGCQCAAETMGCNFVNPSVDSFEHRNIKALDKVRRFLSTCDTSKKILFACNGGDSFTTNARGFTTFFEEFKHLKVTFVVFGMKRNFDTLTLAVTPEEMFQAVSNVLGRSTSSPLTNAEFLATSWLKASLAKEQYHIASNHLKAHFLSVSQKPSIVG